LSRRSNELKPHSRRPHFQPSLFLPSPQCCHASGFHTQWHRRTDGRGPPKQRLRQELLVRRPGPGTWNSCVWGDRQLQQPPAGWRHQERHAVGCGLRQWRRPPPLIRIRSRSRNRRISQRQSWSRGQGRHGSRSCRPTRRCHMHSRRARLSTITLDLPG